MIQISATNLALNLFQKNCYSFCNLCQPVITISSSRHHAYLESSQNRYQIQIVKSKPDNKLKISYHARIAFSCNFIVLWYQSCNQHNTEIKFPNTEKHKVPNPLVPQVLNLNCRMQIIMLDSVMN